MSTSNGVMIFQYFKEINIPVFIKLESEGVGPDFFNFLRTMHFERLSAEEEKKFDSSENKHTSGFRVLEIKSCSPVISKQINMALESDRYGHESISNKGAYKVYRYKGLALIVFAYQNSEWEMALSPNMPLETHQLLYRSVFNRFLSWALAPLGLCGFWGHFTNTGVVIKKMKESHGEAVFFDVIQKRILGPNGIQKITGSLNIFKVDPKVKSTIVMNREELAAYLFYSTSFFDLSGPSTPVRQGILWLTKTAHGVCMPEAPKDIKEPVAKSDVKTLSK